MHAEIDRCLIIVANERLLFSTVGIALAVNLYCLDGRLFYIFLNRPVLRVGFLAHFSI
jgi:hypothetical protein